MPTDIPNKARVGIPWRTLEEQREGKRDKWDLYRESVQRAGGDAEPVSLDLSAPDLQEVLTNFDAFVLPGSPADVNPHSYGTPRHSKTVTLDPDRDRTDLAILEYALRAHKPVLAICYGCQILNVFCHGTLIQDIPSETGSVVHHGKTDLEAGAKMGDLEHRAHLMEGTRLAMLAGETGVTINSSHHQAIDKPGDSLIVSCRSEDGIVEGVEWADKAHWIVGVQWHPERMQNDPLARKLFQDFVSAAAARSRVGAGERS
jgi:putative glutamine amidotransferase